MTAPSDDTHLRIQRFEKLAIEWTSRRWKGHGKVDWIVGRCRPTENRWLKNGGDPEDRLFADFLATFLDNQGEAATKCFGYAGGWKGVCYDAKSADRVSQWLFRNRGAFGNHRQRWQRPEVFPQALRTYLNMVKLHGAKDGDSPSQVKMFSTTKNFDTLYELVKRHVYSFDHLASWDYLVRAYSDHSLPSAAPFDFEPKSFHLEGATGPKRGWALVIFGLNGLEQDLTQDLRHLADNMVRGVVHDTGLTAVDQRPFVWFATEDLLCNCQKDEEVNGKSITLRKLTEEYLESGTEQSMNELLDSLQ